jgi:uncharacterized protein (TIGR03083 family)
MTETSDVDVRDLQSWTAQTYDGLANLLAAGPERAWDASSLCAGWQVRHVVAHVTMPVRLTPEQFGAEMAAARGDVTVLSDTVAARDAALPIAELLAALRSPDLHDWQPPGGGAPGALSHAVIHSLDVSLALGAPTPAPAPAVAAVLDQLAAAERAIFGLDLTGIRLEATDTGWTWGDGEVVRAAAARLSRSQPPVMVSTSSTAVEVESNSVPTCSRVPRSGSMVGMRTKLSRPTSKTTESHDAAATWAG